jgi:pimeloyl-ACP methyl ester carboxylesterase
VPKNLKATARTENGMITTAPLQFLFSKLVSNRSRAAHPNWPHSWPVSVCSPFDGAKIEGWAFRRPEATNGTLFITHGFTSHCMGDIYLSWARYFAERHGFAVASFDFRHHGLSANEPPTFGEAEAQDLKAFVDEAERHNSPRPYILLGESLGALAAQRLAIEDSRISAAALIHPPGWPWDAVGKKLKILAPAGGPDQRSLWWRRFVEGRYSQLPLPSRALSAHPLHHGHGGRIRLSDDPQEL